MKDHFTSLYFYIVNYEVITKEWKKLGRKKRLKFEKKNRYENFFFNF